MRIATIVAAAAFLALTATSLGENAGKVLELARPGTFQEYIDKYTGGEDVGCTIGGQTFRNFKLPIYTSVDEDKLKGPHPIRP